MFIARSEKVKHLDTIPCYLKTTNYLTGFIFHLPTVNAHFFKPITFELQLRHISASFYAIFREFSTFFYNVSKGNKHIVILRSQFKGD